MTRLIDPNALLDEAEEEALDAQSPPPWQPEPECPAFDLSAYAIYDEDVPF